MKQIKIENNGIEQLITVPENSKVTIDGNVVVFEPKFKKGDFVYAEWECSVTNEKRYGVLIFSHKNSDRYYYLFSIFSHDISCFNYYCDSDKIKYRIANEEEKLKCTDELAKKSKQLNSEKFCIEDLKVVPKVGDCVVLKATNLIIYCKVVELYDNIIKFKSHLRNGIISSNGSWRLNISGCEEKVLPEHQFQSELAQLGFEYNFENDTISEIKWKPKEGELYYYIMDCVIIGGRYLTTGIDMERVDSGNYFKTDELCQQAIDKIKQVLNEK